MKDIFFVLNNQKYDFFQNIPISPVWTDELAQNASGALWLAIDADPETFMIFGAFIIQVWERGR